MNDNDDEEAQLMRVIADVVEDKVEEQIWAALQV